MIINDTLQNRSSIVRNFRAVTATGALLATDDVAIVQNGATNVTVTLPAPAANAGRQVTVSRGIGSTGSITVQGAAGQIESLAGALGATTTLSASGGLGSSVVFLSNGTAWLRLLNG